MFKRVSLKALRVHIGRYVYAINQSVILTRPESIR